MSSAYSETSHSLSGAGKSTIITLKNIALSTTHPWGTHFFIFLSGDVLLSIPTTIFLSIKKFPSQRDFLPKILSFFNFYRSHVI